MHFVSERGASWGFPVLFGNGPSSLAVNILMLFYGSCPAWRANATGKVGSLRSRRCVPGVSSCLSPCPLEASAIPLGTEPEQGCPWGQKQGSTSIAKINLLPEFVPSFPGFASGFRSRQPLEAPGSGSGLRAGATAEARRALGTRLSRVASLWAGESPGDLQR